jgi:hypothetical protein
MRHDGRIQRRREPAILGLCLALVAVLAACTKTPPASAGADDPHRAAWNAAGLTNYSWKVNLQCFCPKIRYTVTVVDGKPTDVILDGEPTDIGSKRLEGLPLTVNDLFERIDEAHAKDAVEVDVTYDPDLGYPAHLYVDISRNAADEEIDYTVTSFEPA